MTSKMYFVNFLRPVKKQTVVLIIVCTYIFPLDNVSTENPEDVDELHKGEGGEESEWLPLVTVLTLDHGPRRHVDVSHRTTGQQDLVQHTGRVPWNRDLQKAKTRVT